MAECAARLASLVRAASGLSGRPHLRRPPPRESLLFLLEQEDVPGGGTGSEQAPQTFDELAAMCVKLTKTGPDGRVTQWGYAESMDAGSPKVHTFWRWLLPAAGAR